MDESSLKKSLKHNYGIEILRLIPILSGADSQAKSYQAIADDGGQYFIKLKQSFEKDMGFKILMLLKMNGIQEIIPPLPNFEGKDIQNVEGWFYAVYPFVEGEDGFQKELSSKQWTHLGTMLKKIHSMDVPEDVRAGLRREDFSDQWRNELRAILQAEVSAHGIAREYIQHLESRRDLVEILLNNAKESSKQAKVKKDNFVLCHADIHAGNVLINKQGVFYIVDWDNPMLAPKERDLMFVGAGIGNVWNKTDQVNKFYSGYGAVEIDRELIRYYRNERILVDIVEFYHQIVLSEDDQKPLAFQRYKDMFAKEGVVDIALKTVG